MSPRLRLRTHRSDAVEAYRQARWPPPSTPWRDAAFAVVDLETTGLDPRHDEIISFASVPVEKGRVMVGRTITATVRPKRMPRAETIRIHGLREADLETAPGLDDVLDLILEALTGRVLVAHAAWVEGGFLSQALRRAGLDVHDPVIDTAVLAERVPAARDNGAAEEEVPGEHVVTSPGLSRAAVRHGLPVHRPHHAEGDALTTAQLYIALATQLDRTEPQTVGSLARAST